MYKQIYGIIGVNMKKIIIAILIMTTVLFAANEIHYFDTGGGSSGARSR